MENIERSKCPIFHNIYKSIKNFTYFVIDFFQCCLKIENDVIIQKKPME